MQALYLLSALLAISTAYQHAGRAPAVPSVTLQNAADAGVHMPAAGLGTGCAIGGCGFKPGQDMVAYNMSKTWLAMGGRRFDGADSYGCEPGMGLAIKESPVPRGDVFIVSKTGPGGLAWPLGYNETVSQARAIVHNYSTTYIDLLLVHWPVNYGPCAYHGPKPCIPTTDPLCDTALASYNEKGCRLSTYRALISVWKAGLVRAIGVSNYNITHIEEIKQAGLPLPAVNQVQFSPHHGPNQSPCTPLGVKGVETCGSLLKYCQDNGIVLNGYTPFGGGRGAGKQLSEPKLVAMAKTYNVSTAQVILQWQWQHGIPTNPEATNPVYQKENLYFSTFTLKETDMHALDNWDSTGYTAPSPYYADL